MNRFEDKVALVTGGGSGIGLAIARRLASEGARVFTAQRSAQDEFEFIEADFSDETSAETVIAAIASATGRLDVLVNNAGMMREESLAETSLDTWHKTMQVNLTAPFLLTRAALPLLSESGGNVVNVGSVEGIGANPGHVAYATSKGGLHGFTRAAAVDLGPQGIRCNAVAPGWIDTPLNDDFVASMPDPAAFRRGLAGIHPVGRTGTPDDVAGVVAFLASDDAAFVSGQVYTIDGGRMVKLSLP